MILAPDLIFITETFSAPVMSAWSIALGYAGADVADNYATGPTAAKEVAEEIRRCESRANAARLDLRQ